MKILIAKTQNATLYKTKKIRYIKNKLRVIDFRKMKSIMN
jgi:hypothetical protein